LEYEIDEKNRERKVDTQEVVNYVHALRYGFERTDTLPISLRLIREIHKILLEGVRGSEKDPGEFRTTQNWVGPSGSTPATASYVPPPVHEMKNALHEFEKYLCENKKDPPLIRCALVHAQFETIHPFLDGNGRIGRLLITFMLGVENILARPLLYLSYYFKRNQSEYYDMLMATREKGDWEGWVRFFLNGVMQTAEQAAETARAILDMRETHGKIASSGKLKGKHSNFLLNLLFESPIVTANLVSKILEVTRPTAMALCKDFEKENLLIRMPGRERNVRFAYEPYLVILREGTEL
ncbi:MAG: Fic family protein, partial [bacterium]